MKKVGNKRKWQTVLCLMVFTALFFHGCKDDDDTPKNCGCDSETVFTIPETDNLIGRMAYKTQLDPLDDYYNNKFWIAYTEANCSNCIHHMIVCNEDFLDNEFDYLKNTGESVEVKFSGDLKEVCDKRNNPADYTFNRIKLTSIEQQ